VVFGEGPVPAEVMLVGEQPGDREDVDGRPFVGPAGGVLAHAVERAGWRRQDLYVTNAVKHFKWTPRGKRRLHQTPDRTEVQACRPWLDEELALVKPRLLVLLGATAVKSQLGSTVKVTQVRGRPWSQTSSTSWCPPCTRRRSCASLPNAGPRPRTPLWATCGPPPRSCSSTDGFGRRLLPAQEAKPHRARPSNPQNRLSSELSEAGPRHGTGAGCGLCDEVGHSPLAARRSGLGSAVASRSVTRPCSSATASARRR